MKNQNLRVNAIDIFSKDYHSNSNNRMAQFELCPHFSIEGNSNITNIESKNEVIYLCLGKLIIEFSDLTFR